MPDRSGFNDTGTLTAAGSGTPYWTIGIDGHRNAIALPDISRIVTAVAAPSTLKPMTLTAFVRRLNTNRLDIFTVGNTGNPALYLHIHPTQMGFYSGAYAGNSPAFSADDSWHHYAWVWESGNTIRYYRDGGEIGAVSSSGGGDSNRTTHLGVGAGLAGSGFFSNCVLDDVRFYTRALASSEIAMLARPTSGVVPMGRRGRFIEGAGPTIELVSGAAVAGAVARTPIVVTASPSASSRAAGAARAGPTAIASPEASATGSAAARATPGVVASTPAVSIAGADVSAPAAATASAAGQSSASSLGAAPPTPEARLGGASIAGGSAATSATVTTTLAGGSVGGAVGAATALVLVDALGEAVSGATAAGTLTVAGQPIAILPGRGWSEPTAIPRVVETFHPHTIATWHPHLVEETS